MEAMEQHRLAHRPGGHRAVRRSRSSRGGFRIVQQAQTMIIERLGK